MSKSFVICVIDDDHVYQYMITRTIKENNLSEDILIFSDGEEAIEFLKSNADKIENMPDVIFLDINMPIMDGWQFLEEFVFLKPRIGKKITIYMVSSSVDKADTERATKISELTDYIVKPITPDRLKDIIQELKKQEGY